MSADPTIAYSDTDPALVYSGAWFSSSWNTSDGQSGTLRVTDDLTASVSFAFPVAATAFSVFGVKQLTGGLYSICVDCPPGSQYATNIDGELAFDTGINPPVLLYNLSFPAVGVHTVVLSNLPDPSGTPANSSQLALASFVLVVPPAALPTATITATITSEGAGTAVVQGGTATLSASGATLINSTTTASGTSSAPSSPSSPTTHAPASSTSSATEGTASYASATASSSPAGIALSAPVPAHAGTVVGATLGALVFVCAVAAVVYWRHRRRRPPAQRITPYTDTARAPPFTPAGRTSGVVDDAGVLRGDCSRELDASPGATSPNSVYSDGRADAEPRVAMTPPATLFRAPSILPSERKSGVMDGERVRGGSDIDSDDADAPSVSPPPSYSAPAYNVR
ncbi:hypothetical protein HYPSUDRAFT_198182 [Hypholoma sublateritium FD-334 SS-4]|uniref:Uncharacterized protein n=1 Tax=Hypholoma sublateritium (strain FD-334 SS-4) TaxID=945553 RepID=A0A0D2LIC3_HYPSF|nr:hypothetical protein HYPSUDRAFT_198182 [Hypholoma sublateritium FD-334 SS-4]